MTPRRYLAFDIETAKLLPEGVDDLMSHRPLGIACAAAFAADSGEPMSWCGWGGAGAGDGARSGGGAPSTAGPGRPAPRMSREEAAALVADLQRLVADGYTLLTWNGLAFDFPVLAEESGEQAACAALAAAHVDMMFHVVCSQGHRLALRSAAAGMSLPGKLAGLAGADAPRLWAAGEHDTVLAYCGQDVRLTADLAAACERAGALRWMTRRGTQASIGLPGGWLTVTEARRLPEPDTSWMTAAPRRGEMCGWMG